MVSRLPSDESFSSGQDPAQRLYAELRESISRQDFETWIERTPCRFLPPDTFVLRTPNKFRKAWMEKNFRDLLRTCARSLFDFEARIEFEVAALPEATTQPLPPAPSHARYPKATKDPPPPPRSSDRVPCHPRTQLNASFTFENFVVGPPNRVAQAAAIAVCDDPAGSYNPLFLYGEPGVGKTHLLQAICHRLLATARRRITFLSSEHFVDEFLASATRSDCRKLRSSCHDTDVLVLDDVQFVADRARTQDDLLTVLNILLESRKQVILSSRCPPHDSAGLQGRLASHFRYGLVTRIDPPNFELRVSILLRKARLRHLELPAELAELLAGRLTRSVCELEGALTRLSSIASLAGSAPSLDMGRQALDELTGEQPTTGTVTIAQIIELIRHFYQLKPKDLLARSKARSLVLPRQVGMFLARRLTQLSLQEIGMHFGGRDHTTVLYAEERIEHLQRTNSQLRADLRELRHRLASSRLS